MGMQVIYACAQTYRQLLEIISTSSQRATVQHWHQRFHTYTEIDSKGSDCGYFLQLIALQLGISPSIC